MKVLCKCGGFYLTEGMSCPVCGYKLTDADCLAHMDAQKEFAKTAKKKAWEPSNFYESKDAEKAAMAEYKRQRREEKETDRWPVSAVLISVEYRQKALAALWHTAYNYWIGGFWYAHVKEKDIPRKPWKATFRVNYASGRIGTETVVVNSVRYHQLKSVLDS